MNTGSRTESAFSFVVDCKERTLWITFSKERIHYDNILYQSWRYHTAIKEYIHKQTRDWFDSRESSAAEETDDQEPDVPDQSVSNIVVTLEPLSDRPYQAPADMEIVTADGEYLSCVSDNLKSHSLYYESLLHFEAHCWEKISNLSQFEPHLVRAFVDLTHGKAVELPVADCLPLADLGAFLASDSLIKAVDRSLYITVEDNHDCKRPDFDVLALYEAARAWPHGKLAATVRGIERTHFWRVCRSEAFLQIGERELVNHLKDGGLVATEAVGLRAITNWVAANGHERPEELYAKVRLQDIAQSALAREEQLLYRLSGKRVKLRELREKTSYVLWAPRTYQRVVTRADVRIWGPPKRIQNV